MSEKMKSKTVSSTQEDGEVASVGGMEICPECESEDIDNISSETVCNDCGLVIDDQSIDRGPEWRAFNSTQRRERSRTGHKMTNLLHDKGLSTEISWQDKDAKGNSLSSRKREQMGRLRKWHKRSSTSSSGERNLRQALGEIQRMSSALGLPEDVREVAATIYRRALEEDLIRGRSIESTATACLYAAATQSGVARGFEEITTVSRVDEKAWTRNYRHLMKELGLAIEPNQPTDFLPKYAQQLNISHQAEIIAEYLLEESIKENLASGKSRLGLVAASIYCAGLIIGDEGKITQQEIAREIDATEVTIRNRYQEMIKLWDSESKPEIEDEYGIKLTTS